MQFRAFPADLVAVSDGMFDGYQHVLLFLAAPGRSVSSGVALSLADARALHLALGVLLARQEGEG
jgi:hypothetical protein